MKINIKLIKKNKINNLENNMTKQNKCKNNNNSYSSNKESLFESFKK
jgi:hypothetical protein